MTALQVLRSGTPEATEALDRLTRRAEEVLDPATLAGAADILARVRREGDDGLLELARRLDGADAASVADLALRPFEGDLDGFVLPNGFAEALGRAIDAVGEFHRPQVRSGYVMERDGVELEERATPLRRVGVYVPGGRASYPSTVVMTVVPAQVAGVREIAVATPAGSYLSNAALRYTLARLGVQEVWGIGGAQAVAAFAYGTATIRRVDKIVGPGNAWVTAAKKLVVGDVAIDGIAGPSEVVIVADSGSDPALVAADLLAQAEHDPLAAAVLITPDEALARAVAGEIEEQLGELSTAEIARESLRRFGLALVVQDLEEALEAVERIAPEHLQLVGPGAERLAWRVVAAGAIFMGADTPEAFGDYIAGPSHVLPTCGSARFASALGVEDFLRRSHRVRFTAEAARRDAWAAAVLAEAEGLPAHQASAERRRG
ncbi:MAG TPA: histidinol dehydrogenase [Thermoanaerobaculia bacterium]|nr:histidinol dehydrogenase [Thermoanaerobaculia bacterium]